VRAKNLSGYSAWSALTNFASILLAPTNLNVEKSTANDISLTWSANSRVADGYIIERKQNSQSTFSVLDTLMGGGGAYTDKKWVSGQTYTYRIRAFNQFTVSDYSNEVSLLFVGVDEVAIPKEYSLKQNYPNPFNPSTLIEYALPKASTVTLTVTNSLGQVVAVLASGKQDAGVHLVTWNASSVPSGTYFCRLQARQTDGGQAGEYVATRKMILLK